MSDLDAARIERATGWRVVHKARTGSTNDDAAALRDAGAGARTVVVADAQSAGRGREGRAFVSPPGGLYVSLLVDARPQDLPAPLVAAVALAAAEAVERASGLQARIKWPNDLWLGERKVGGILLEAPPAPHLPAIAGIGVNVAGVPLDLHAEVRATLTALNERAARPVERAALLIALLGRVDARLGDLADAAARLRLAEAYAVRQALLGAPICWTEAGQPHAGTLCAAGLDAVEVDEPGRGRRRLRAEHVVDVRPRR